jgi:hypothetical protein
MNALQVNFVVHDLAAGVRFYSAMFVSEPAVLKSDFAKWMLNDPRVSFTICARDASPCVVDLSGLHPYDAQPLTSNDPLTLIREYRVDPPLTSVSNLKLRAEFDHPVGGDLEKSHGAGGVAGHGGENMLAPERHVLAAGGDQIFPTEKEGGVHHVELHAAGALRQGLGDVDVIHESVADDDVVEAFGQFFQFKP